MRSLLTAFFFTGIVLLSAISVDDVQFLLDREQFQLLEKYAPQIEELLEKEPGIGLDYATRTGNRELAFRCHYALALRDHSLDNAVQYIQLAGLISPDSLTYKQGLAELLTEFSSPEDRLVLDYYQDGMNDEEFLAAVKGLERYNPLIEDQAKALIDEISVERSDSLALALIGRFEERFPLSKWSQIAYYYKLYHLSLQGDYSSVADEIVGSGRKSPELAYISALFLLNPNFRKDMATIDGIPGLAYASDLIAAARGSVPEGKDRQILYDTYDKEHWDNRLRLTQAKLSYYGILAKLDRTGNEDSLLALIQEPDKEYSRLLEEIRQVEFDNNDNGEIAELEYWRGRIQALYVKPQFQLIAAKSLIRCLVLGAPRKKYDDYALQLLSEIHARLGIRTGLMDWARSLVRYRGIAFEEFPSLERSFTRIALGDYDNDGFDDLLFNGRYLYRNMEGSGFEDVSEQAGLKDLNGVGGLWADFNQDGLLDLVSLSHNSDSLGDALMKNMDQTRFVKVNERAGDIDDLSPTEGAAWIDIDGRGFPSLYCANYEKWQIQSGFPDYFWYNRQGYFQDDSVSRGFRLPIYASDPGLAGRGVAPADLDNDGRQEILVTNYRLNRNFLWKQNDSLFVDLAALYGVSGKYKEGYYGHSIGADWGDYDNDGDLDLFIANLAHPRYIDISDVSLLLRNDGHASRVVEADTLYYWKFTDVTRQAGISYDELHSDPLFFDADNDGWLDLFITSVYENDRSYLYKNNGDGTFTDITWLAGARVYNGWGNATGDLDRDGLADLVVGSGNGTRILHNRTATRNASHTVKPVWKSGEILLCDNWRDYGSFPNSPAFGTRLKATLQRPDGQTYELIRELSGGKGTTSQNAQELHFGLGRNKLLKIERVDHAETKN
jgi:hypothetical protein